MPGTNFKAKVTETLYFREIDEQGLALSATCIGTPPTTAGLFQHGCLIIQTDAIGDAVYQNVGTTAVPQWTLTSQNALPSAQTQATWYIDPLNGVDTNTGQSSGSAIKTWAELLARVPDGSFKQNTNIYILNDMPVSDPLLMIGWTMSQEYFLEIYGTRTVVHSGTFTSVTDRVQSTNTPNRVTDTALASWAPYIGGGHMLVPTGGDAEDAPAFIAKNLGSNAARVSSFFSYEDFVEKHPNTLDTYDIVKLTHVPSANVNSSGGWVTFHDLDFVTLNEYHYPIITCTGIGGANFAYCHTTYNPLCAGLVRHYNCQGKAASMFSGTFMLSFAGLYMDTEFGITDIEVEEGAQWQISDGALFQGLGLAVINGGYVRIYDAGIFDTTVRPIELHAFGNLRAEQLWGANNVGPFIQTAGSGRVATAYAITGTGSSPGVNDLSLNGVLYSWAAVNSAGYIQSPTSMACISPI